MTPPPALRRGIALRTALRAAAIGAGVYIALIAAVIAWRIKPTADSLRAKSVALLAQYNLVRARTDALRSARDEIATLVASGPRGEAALAAVRRHALLLEARLDTLAPGRSADQVPGIPTGMRTVLAAATGTQSSLGTTLYQALAALQLGRGSEAAARLDDADSIAALLNRRVADADRLGMVDLIARERSLSGALRTALSALAGWMVLGAFFVPLIAVFVQRRFYRPLEELDRGLSRVAGGDLEGSIPVRRADELGRLGAQFNQMTGLLRERAEDERRRREDLSERYRTMFESAPVGMALVDARGRYRQANPALERFLGYPAAELAGRHFSEVTLPEDVAETDRQFQALLWGARDRFEMEKRYRRKDGDVVWARLSVNAVRDAKGVLVHTVSMIEDITAQKLDEAAVRDRDQQLRSHHAALVQLAQSPALYQGDSPATWREITESAGRTLGVARVGIWLYDAERTAIRCVDLYELPANRHGTLGAHAAAEYPAYRRALDEDRVIAAHDVHADPRTQELSAGHVATAAVTSRLDAPIRVGGRTVGVVCHEHTGPPRQWSAEAQSFAGSIADIAGLALQAGERRRLEEQLLQSQKLDAVGRLAGGVAHDFNNLLSAMLGYAEITQRSLAAEDPRRADLEEIRRAGRRAADLIHQLLAFARRQVIEPRVVSVNELIANMQKMLRRLIGADVELATSLAPDAEPVKVDPGQFEQVVMNLVVNARHAMPAGGKLMVTTGNVHFAPPRAAEAGVAPGPFVRVSVSDTGVGMSAETMSRVFEPFFTTKEPGQGTGLGLATCYGIVKQANGHIAVTSEVGCGTTFEIYLPVADERPAQAPAAEEEAAPSGTETLLLVEDEEQVRAMATRLLGAQGYEVLAAGDPDQALAIVRDHSGSIHLMITDVVLPRMSGRVLAQRVMEARPETRVLYISGYAEDVIVHRGVLEPGVSYLQKPLTAATLARRVREVLDAPVPVRASPRSPPA
ncbi:MAG TPA: PAS domain S-box protein [Gemmatimonadales bacterium]|nr:PAS domain S-box protein [Gemmatimonadales bacterium]